MTSLAPPSTHSSPSVVGQYALPKTEYILLVAMHLVVDDVEGALQLVSTGVIPDLVVLHPPYNYARGNADLVCKCRDFSIGIEKG